MKLHLNNVKFTLKHVFVFITLSRTETRWLLAANLLKATLNIIFGLFDSFQ